jgi:hypothetical protein
MSTDAKPLSLIHAKLNHDLRSHLNVILGYAGMVVDDLQDSGETGSILGDVQCIVQAGEDLLTLAHQVEYLIAVENGDQSQGDDEVAIEEAIEDVIADLAARFGEQTSRVEGSARIEHTDRQAFVRLLSCLFHRLTGLVKRPCEWQIRVSGAGDGDADGTAVVIGCQLSVPDVQLDLPGALQALAQPVVYMRDIKDFDGYYLSSILKRVGARLTANQGDLRIVFSD